MKRNAKKSLSLGLLFLALFALWTLLILNVDVRLAGESETPVGFAALNCRFHAMTGVHMGLYTATDWLGLIPVAVCLLFAVLGAGQLIGRKRLRNVDFDIRLLGGYYIIVLLAYLLCERFPVNYRPILMDGRVEASYPSSTTLMVLTVMPTLSFQAERRICDPAAAKLISVISGIFSIAMVLARTLAGVHWLTDIVGAVLLSCGLFWIYKGAVLLRDHRSKSMGGR